MGVEPGRPGGGQEQLTWVDFQAQLENPHLHQLFHALDVDDSGRFFGKFPGKPPIFWWVKYGERPVMGQIKPPKGSKGTLQ